MHRKIIVGHDLHEGGADALAFGRLIAGQAGAELVVAGVFPIGTLPRGFEARWREQEEQVAREIQAIADAAGAEAEAFPSGSPARGLHELADEIDADLIVVGSSRHSRIGQVLAGNVGLGLLHGSPCAVAVVPRGYRDHSPGTLREIVVGFDGSPESGLALLGAVDLAKAGGASLDLVTVAVPPAVVGHGVSVDLDLEEALEAQLRGELDEAIRSIPDGVSADGTVLRGDPVQRLVETASRADILIVGSRGYGPLKRVVLGSVAAGLVRSARCPVLVNPRGAQSSTSSGGRRGRRTRRT
jgi:nucleotide-binding universal stress UspA family protein